MLIRRLLGLSAALTFIVLGLVTTGPAAQAATWTLVDKNCASNDSGTLCVKTFKSSTGWKGTWSVAPKPGHWMKVTSVNVSAGNYGWTVCADSFEGNECPAQQTSTKTWSEVSEGKNQFVLLVDVKTDTTRISRAAGRTNYSKLAGECATVAEGTACAEGWFQMRRAEFFYRGRVVLTPATGQTMRPVKVRVAMVTRPRTGDGAARTDANTTTFDVAAQSSRWVKAGKEVKQPDGRYIDSLTVGFTYVSGGTTRSVSVTWP